MIEWTKQQYTTNKEI